MNGDGSSQTNLSNNAELDYPPVFSPDSSKIAFMSNRDGNFEVYIMNADGSGLKNLSNNMAHEWKPVFSPDGTEIAFQSDRDGNQEIYVMITDGSGVQQTFPTTRQMTTIQYSARWH
jgi:Tol biopolymer transport system component